MSNALIARAFYLSCELSAQGIVLPPAGLMNKLKAWGNVISAGAQYGLGGASQQLPGTSYAQLSGLYEAGIESGSEGGAQELRSILAGLISTKLCEDETSSAIEKLELNAKLYQWFKGGNGQVDDAALDWDSEVDTPPFTKTGWFPIDNAASTSGIAQGVSTLLSQPGVGKTTALLAMAIEWRKQNIGPVTMINTEIPPAMLLYKLRGMGISGLFRKGEDKLIFGLRNCDQALQDIIDNPDENKLVLVDSVTGYAGQGDTSSSRERFSNLYTAMVQAANCSRLLVAATHVKRGVDPVAVGIEDSAGCSAIERFSRYMAYMSLKDTGSNPSGYVDVRIKQLKNNYGPKVSPFTFGFNHVTGHAVPSGDDDEGEYF